MEMWLKDNCPACNAVNWFDTGDPQDMTGADIDECQCHACRQVWTPNEDIVRAPDDEEEDGNATMGLAVPY